MAVDSASKRFSLVGFGCPIPQMVNVPNAADPTPARYDLIYLYSGISLDAPAPEPEGPPAFQGFVRANVARIGKR